MEQLADHQGHPLVQDAVEGVDVPLGLDADAGEVNGGKAQVSPPGESEESQKLGLEIVGHMRKLMDDKSEETGLNFTLLATPAEGFPRPQVTSRLGS